MRKFISALLFLFLVMPSYAENKEKLLPPHGKTIVMPNASSNTEHLDVFQQITSYTPQGHKFWMTLDDPDYLELHQHMEPYNNSLMITLLFGKDTKGKELASQSRKLGAVISGKYDDAIDKIGNELRSFGKPVYLDIGNEAEFFYTYNSREFIIAYRHIQERLKPLCGNNTLFFWHTITDLGFASRPSLWYPGDNYVDGIALSLYNDSQFRSVEEFVNYAKQRRMPVAIFEVGLTPQKATKGYYQRIFNLVERYDIPLLGYASFGDEVFSSPGLYHHTRIDYLSHDVQDLWKKTIRSSRYKE